MTSSRRPPVLPASEASSAASAEVRETRSNLRLLPATGAPAPTDEQLIEAMRRGDARVARFVYPRLRPAVDRALMTVLGRREPDHEDLVQLTMEHVVRSVVSDRFAGACRLSTWASRIATHLAISELRKRRTRRRWLGLRIEALESEESEGGFDVRELGGAVESPEAEYAARAMTARVRAFLARIDPAKAETLLLHDLLGHELTEIAHLTGVTVAAAQSRLVRTRRALVEALEGDEGS